MASGAFGSTPQYFIKTALISIGTKLSSCPVGIHSPFSSPFLDRIRPKSSSPIESSNVVLSFLISLDFDIALTPFF